MPTREGLGEAEAAARMLVLEEVFWRNWQELLAAEKRRRGVDAGRLVFVGVHTVADIWWCGLKAVRTARMREPVVFHSYLRDRLSYSLQLGRIEQLPRRVEDWLTIGDDLTSGDVEALLGRQAKARRRQPFVAEVKDGVLYVDPTLSADKREWCSDWARRMGWALASADQDRRLYRQMVRENRAEHYPTIRWNFAWEGYVLVADPDGLTDEFAYELRITPADWLGRRFVKPVATTEADLYGCLFGRAGKRVQIHVLSTGRTLTIAGPVDRQRAEGTLRTFQEIDGGQMPDPPLAWKCAPGRCEFSSSCPIRGQANLGPRAKN